VTRFGFSVEKSTLYRGVQQPFANVYHYELPYTPTQTSQLEAVLDRLVALEKISHATVVNFQRGRCWNTGSGSQAGNQMRIDKALSGTGAGNDNSSWDRERAILFRWPAGINSRGKPVYLRKWFHTCGNWGSLTVPAGLLGNTAQWGQTNINFLHSYADQFHPIVVGGITVGDLVAQSGRAATGPAQAHAYLEHHQLGDQWR
jgi:hypothetical protein